MKSFKKFLAEEMTTASTGGGSSQKDQNSGEYEEIYRDFWDRVYQLYPSIKPTNPNLTPVFDDADEWGENTDEEPSEEKPEVGPDSLTPEEIEFINNGEPKPSDYQNADEWEDALERYWRLYFQYFNQYQNSPDLPAQIANDAYERWMKENWEFEWLRNNPPPEIQNYSSEEEYQRAFDEWIKDLEYERWQYS